MIEITANGKSKSEATAKIIITEMLLNGKLTKSEDTAIQLARLISGVEVREIPEKDGEKMREAIEALEYPTGHWITGRSMFFDVEVYRCSECKSWFVYKAEECPNCHARMIGEKE